MALITLTSDLGLRDNYVALVKASILEHIPGVQAIDISHEIEKFNLMQAAYIFGNAYTHFPPGTIHLVGIKSHIEAKRLLLIDSGRQKIICPDNGFCALLPNPEQMKIFSFDEKRFAPRLFFLKDAMVKAGAAVLAGISEAVKPSNDHLQLMSFQPTATSDAIVGKCIHIDSFGNVITNITQQFFEQSRQGRKFIIHLPGSQINRVVKDYGDVPETNALALFNSFGYLEIAINRARASQLLFPKNTQANTDFNITVQFE